MTKLHIPGSSGRDWVEDFGHENGNYLCQCKSGCGQMFFGYKRRVICKQCATPKEPRDE
jgi:hypothetical protein